MAQVVRPPESVPWAGRLEIARLAFPILYGEVVGVITPLVIVAIMSRVDEEALYLRSLYVPLALLFIALQMGLDISNQVAAALSRGRGRPQDVLPTAASMVVVGGAVWGAVALAVIAGAPWIASLLEVPPGSTADFVSFVRWICCANLLWLPVSLCTSSLRGYGHVRSAAGVVLLGAGVEIATAAVLGFGTGLGMYALPIAMAAGGVAALSYAVLALVRTEVWRSREALNWRPEAVTHLASVGGPITISFVVIAASNFGLMWVVAPFGPDVVSGFSAAAALETLILVPSTAIGSATAITMNRLRGAGRPDLVMSAMKAGLGLAWLTYSVLALAVWLPRAPLASLIAGAPDVAAQTELFLGIVGLTYGCMGITVTAIVVIEQIGGGFLALLLNIPYFLGTVAVGALFARAVGVQGLYWTLALLNATGVLTAPLLASRFVRRRFSGGPR
ncbi:MATE family efflux transporter [Nonomuraea deserti]|uniref:MATE family efflux transporter n=1 Tax=Nonomuraea deserti TaxID=1848322 RepID=A0A4R4W7G6_9ACTN|nr:MATE family efflux transporter [Nonomuraea deserti]TDD11055.1 MATE family efflux transporter [Nonomuraea deserti]